MSIVIGSGRGEWVRHQGAGRDGFPGSTKVIVNPGTNPDNASISDSNYGTGSGTNRDDILASGDGGATALNLDINQGFTISTTLTLSDGTNAPRKEAGIRINAPVTGDALFIVNSDAGEIVAFGGGAPFHLFGSNGGGNGYVPGTPITLSERYDPPGTSGRDAGAVDLLGELSHCRDQLLVLRFLLEPGGRAGAGFV